MCPQSELVDFSESRDSRGLSWISFFKHQGKKETYEIVLNRSGNFHNRTSDCHPLEEAVAKAQTISQDIGQKDHLQRYLQEASEKSLKSDWKIEQKQHTGSQSGKLTKPLTGDPVPAKSGKRTGKSSSQGS